MECNFTRRPNLLALFSQGSARAHVGLNLLLGLGLSTSTAGSALAQTPESLKFSASSEVPFDNFGSSVTTSGTQAVIGSPSHDGGVSSGGCAYLYDMVSGIQLLKLQAEDREVGDRFGISVAMTDEWILVGSPYEDSKAKEAGAAYVFDAASGFQKMKLTASDGASLNLLGNSVAIEGATAVAGAPLHDTNGLIYSGAAYVFDVTTGQELLKLTAASPLAGDSFGASAAIRGNRILIGCPKSDDLGVDSGSVHVFDLATGQQLAKLTASDGAPEDRFGSSLSAQGDRVLVGAQLGSGGQGAVYVFDINTGQELEKLSAGDGQPGDWFGARVALDGDTAVIGASGHDGAGADSGAIYLFDVVSGQQLTKLTALDGAEGDMFGGSVALSNSRILIGARGDDDSGEDSGSAYVLDLASGSELQKLSPQDGAAMDYLGSSVAVSGPWAMAGAPRDDDNGLNSGSAYVFDVTSGEELFKLTAADGSRDDQFGSSVAISGERAVIGAYFDSDQGYAIGSAYVYELVNGVELLKLTPSDGSPGDIFGRSVSISGDLAVIGAPMGDDLGSSSGAAYVFDVSTGQELFKLLASDGSAGDQFGGSVAVRGSWIVVGAHGVPGSDTSGSAYVFDADSGQELFKLLPSDSSAGDRFGQSVAVGGSHIVVGAPGNVSGSGPGSAYVFDLESGQELHKLIASTGSSDDRFGWTVTASGSTGVIGAYKSSEYGAYSYDLTTGLQITGLEASGAFVSSAVGYSVALSEGTAVVGATGDVDNGLSAGAAYVFEMGSTDVVRYCGATQNPNNAAVIDIDTVDSSAGSINVSLSSGPASQFIYLLVGNGIDTVSQPPGAKGDLCIVGGSCLGRYDKDVGQISSAGTFSTDIRNTISNPCAGAVTITPGATWNFQYWHRQPMGQPATFSDAISVTFE